MKLELVLLTIIVSSITERQVEANPDRLECYPFRNLTGAKVTIYGNTHYFRYDNFAIEACRVYGTWLFFSGEVFFGKVNAISGNGTIYHPRERFVIDSISKVPKKSDKSGIVLYGDSLIDERSRFRVDKYSYFHKETNISGRVFGKSVVVFGSKDWTVESECKGANCKNVKTCFTAPGAGKASFVEEVSNLGRILSVVPGQCLGKKITGKTSIPECPCNQEGVVDDANKCQGINGICNCLSTHTGYDCDWCQKPLVIQGDGTCKAAGDCGCDPRGVDKDYSCTPSNSKDGKCNCNQYARGDKCDQCAPWAGFMRKSCRACYCPWDRADSSVQCNDDTGKCNCKKQFAGDSCERCATNYSPVKTACLDGFQLNQTIQLNSYCKDTSNTPSRSDVLTLIRAMHNKGVWVYLPGAWYRLSWGMIGPRTAACQAYNRIGLQ